MKKIKDLPILSTVRRIIRENKLLLYIETGNIYHDNLNMNESIYDFILAQQENSKNLLKTRFSYGGDFDQYTRTYLGEIEARNDDKYDLLTNKISKYLFY